MRNLEDISQGAKPIIKLESPYTLSDRCRACLSSPSEANTILAIVVGEGNATTSITMCMRCRSTLLALLAADGGWELK